MHLKVARARRVRFFYDYGHEWPLWESFTEKYTMEPSDYGLSRELTDVLKRSYELWIAHADAALFAHVPAGSDHLWRKLSDQALAMLRFELADVAEVVDERFT